MRALSKCGFQAVFCNTNSTRKRQQGIESLSESLHLANGLDLHSAIGWARFRFPRQPVVVYHSYPPQERTVRAVGADLVAFDSLDEPVNEFSHWLADYKNAVLGADIVLASAASLVTRVKTLRDDVISVPNGCDFEFFRRASERFPRPDALVGITGPIIGFVGAVATWLDWDLILELVEIRADYSYVFIGPLYGLREPPIQAKNVHFLGHQDYTDLPMYMSHFDACLLPFQINEMTKGVNPIKLWEYMASGKPILSTALPEVPKEYVTTMTRENLRTLDIRDTEADRAARIAFAKRNSWNERAVKIKEVLMSKIGGVLT